MATSPSSNQASGPKYGDLKRRIIFLLLALVVYRIGAHVPVPGIDPDMLSALLSVCVGDHAVHLCIHYYADAVLCAPLA